MGRKDFKAELKDPTTINAINCTFISIIACFIWQNNMLYSLSIVIGALNLGMALERHFICRQFHTEEALLRLMDNALRNAVLHMDAERIAKGLKPISEIYDDT